MPSPESQESKRLIRYHGQSMRFLRDAMDVIRKGQWRQSEELLWGSLTLAVKGVALSRGQTLDSQAAVREFAEMVGHERRDRRIREAFKQLDAFSDTAERVRESRSRADSLVVVLEDVTAAVERLWEILPIFQPPEPVEGDDIQDLEDDPFEGGGDNPRNRRRPR